MRPKANQAFLSWENSMLSSSKTFISNTHEYQKKNCSILHKYKIIHSQNNRKIKKKNDIQSIQQQREKNRAQQFGLMRFPKGWIPHLFQFFNHRYMNAFAYSRLYACKALTHNTQSFNLFHTEFTTFRFFRCRFFHRISFFFVSFFNRIKIRWKEN